MTRNEGSVDRALRILAGLALLAWFFADQGNGALHWLKLVGLVPLATGLLGSCPLYRVFGISTCRLSA